MKKIGLITLVIIMISVLWFGENRRFYCVGKGKCITVWKTYNNTCYIISGKYYGIIKPSNNYIKTTNTNDITIYWYSKLENTIIIKCEKDYKIVNNGKEKITMIDYNSDSSKYHKILYKMNAQKFCDVREEVDYIDLGILEYYAKDKNAKDLNH